MPAPTATLGDVVLEQPAAAGLFERLGLDYCCGGRRTLAEACEERGLDPATVAAVLDTLSDEPADADAQAHDVAGASIAQLCDHIVASHHDRLRDDLPRIAELLSTVVRVHGAERAELATLQQRFTALREELEAHMRLEEESLFPACRALERDGERASDGDRTPDRDRASVDPALLTALLEDHSETAGALADMRALTDGHRTDTALCSTHRRLLEQLLALERDMHLHVHEENNVLFPRVSALAGG